jgi:hypothetical protein
MSTPEEREAAQREIAASKAELAEYRLIPVADRREYFTRMKLLRLD